MRPASFSPAQSRRRAISFGLAVAAHVLIVLLLLRLAPAPELRPPEDAPLTTFNVPPAAEERAKVAARPRTVAKPASARAEAVAPAAAAPPPVPVPAPKPPPMLVIPGMFEAADIGKMHGGADDDGDSAGAGDSVAAYGPGEGPGGQKLYNAEWYRRPSHAELAGYLPQGAPPESWAMIACRTIADYHVENCRSLGEAPAGSGLARAMREAAWQFRVRPPRIGGKPLIGAWVRICFDFNGGEANNRCERV